MDEESVIMTREETARNKHRNGNNCAVHPCNDLARTAARLADEMIETA